jgi:hypothetical protein
MTTIVEARDAANRRHFAVDSTILKPAKGIAIATGDKQGFEYMNGAGFSIIDIRLSTIDNTILDDLLLMLQPSDGQEKRMPTILLYDEAGLKLFEDVTYLDEYYLTNAEIEVLEKNADKLAERIQAGSMVIELGSGYGFVSPDPPLQNAAPSSKSS